LGRSRDSPVIRRRKALIRAIYGLEQWRGYFQVFANSIKGAIHYASSLFDNLRDDDILLLFIVHAFVCTHSLHNLILSELQHLTGRLTDLKGPSRRSCDDFITACLQNLPHVSKLIDSQSHCLLTWIAILPMLEAPPKTSAHSSFGAGRRFGSGMGIFKSLKTASVAVCSR
jgi:hypothetical protein